MSNQNTPNSQQSANLGRNDNTDYYDEISLRELIETLIGGWKMIIGITLVAIIIAGIYSFSVLEATYEAKTVLLAMNASDKVQTNESKGAIEDVIDTARNTPMTLETYKEQIKMPQILTETIEELNLGEREITQNKLAKMISLGTIKNTQMITITVTSTDKTLAKDIANHISEKFVRFLTKNTELQINKSATFIEKQMNSERENLDQALVSYKDFLGQSKGISELQAEQSMILTELNSLKSQLTKEQTNYEEQLVDNTIGKQTLQATLKSVDQQLTQTAEKIVTTSSVAKDPLMKDIVAEETLSSTSQLANIELNTEFINENYTALERQKTSTQISLDQNSQSRKNLEYKHNQKIKILTSKVNELTINLEKIQIELADKQHQEKLIQRKINLAQSSYDNFAKKYEQARIAQASVLESSNIAIISKATEPESPVGPRKALNLAIAAVLGMMISVMIVFFRAYWKSTETK